MSIEINLQSFDVVQRLIQSAKTQAAKAYANEISSAENLFQQPAVTVKISTTACRLSSAHTKLAMCSQNAIDEAQRRLNEGQVVERLALTEDNKKLYDELGQEMKKCNSYSTEGLEQLNNLSRMRQQLLQHGWDGPMTREQLMFEAEVDDAIHSLNAINGAYDELDACTFALYDEIEDLERAAREWAEKQPDPARWAENGLTMPRRPKGVNTWGLPEMAAVAGIDPQEMRTVAQEYAKIMNGSEVFDAMEKFVSDRFAAL
ncbi:MAG: hypothetical protein LBQ63_00005 [Deltaproteobacteria bacterium]|jgi:hypothetical protein|nr:hypothetical protein [Deltaproteobacteria bacterium]